MFYLLPIFTGFHWLQRSVTSIFAPVSALKYCNMCCEAGHKCEISVTLLRVIHKAQVVNSAKGKGNKNSGKVKSQKQGIKENQDLAHIKQ